MTFSFRLVGLLVLLVLAGCEANGGATAPSPAVTQTASPSPDAGPSPEPVALPTELGIDPASPVSAPGVLRVGAGGTQLGSAPGQTSAGRLRAGVVVPFSAVNNGWARITTPCELTRWMPLDAGDRLARPVVVLDPGHGGGETGAVGPTGLQEKEVNLDVAVRAAAALNGRGIPTLLIRDSDYRATLPFRVEVASASGTELMISIHHNADPDGPMDRPGTETYFQYRSAASKRLAGLVYEEVFRELSKLPVSWVGDTDAGAKWRLNDRGGDYYGILRRSGEQGVITVLAELSFVSNPAEEEMLRREDVRQAKADAIVRAVERYRNTNDPGSGFTTPYPRTQPAGPGGGAQGCVDPA